VLSALLGVAALVAAIIVGWRSMQRRAVERAQPGRSPASAIAIQDYGEIEIAVRLQACACGGRFALRGESPANEYGRPLRVALLECRRCEREQRVFFDLTAIRH